MSKSLCGGNNVFVLAGHSVNMTDSAVRTGIIVSIQVGESSTNWLTLRGIRSRITQGGIVA